MVGPSGGGKSTTCSLLPRFYDVATGSISIDGQDVRDVTQQSLRRAIGLVQQDVYLFDGTIGENIAYGKPGATAEEIAEAARRANIDAFIESLPQGYDTVVGERGSRLSGGQKQRVAIAGVIAMRPDCLTLDESTAMLDPRGRAQVMKTIRNLRDAGISIVSITHYMEEAAQADRVLVMSRGRIVMEGTPEEVFSQTQRLHSYHLDVPQAPELRDELAAAGLPMPENIITPEECAKAIFDLLKKKAVPFGRQHPCRAGAPAPAASARKPKQPIFPNQKRHRLHPAKEGPGRYRAGRNVTCQRSLKWNICAMCITPVCRTKPQRWMM